MAHFKNAYESHDHSLEVLNVLYGYDSFLDNLTRIADMGCGAGLDSAWWATLETRDDPPIPHNYQVYAVDKVNVIEPDILANNKNITFIEADFEQQRSIPIKVDLVWAHDVLQYARDPLSCLINWKQQMNVNGMLILAVPQTTFIRNNNLVVENRNQLYNFNILNLMYMLALAGFDTRDAYYYRKENSPWLYAAVYATDREPMPYTTTWYELADKKLLLDSAITSVNRYGYPKIEDLIICWLDKNFYTLSS